MNKLIFFKHEESSVSAHSVQTLIMYSDEHAAVNLSKEFISQQNNIIYKSICTESLIIIITDI